LKESVDVIEFHATDAYSNLDLTNDLKRTIKQSIFPKDCVIALIRPRSLIHSEKTWSTWWWKYNLESR